MARIEIRDVGAVGVILDRPSHELPPNVWSNLRNIRAKDGFLEPLFGETPIFDGNPAVTPPLNLFPCPTVNGDPYWVYGGEDKIGVVDGTSVHEDITPTATTLSADAQFKWSGTWLNGVFFMNSRANELMVWDNIDPITPVLMKKMSTITDTEFQATWRFTSLRAYKEILIGLGFADGSAEYPTTIVWSGPATAGTVPISWDAANLNNIAGERPLSATPGRVIDGMQLGNSFLICKEDATIIGNFAQGSSPLVFRYIDNNSGVLTVNCMVEFAPGRMLILNQNYDVMVTEGTQVTSILTGRLRKALANRINRERDYECFVVHNFVQREVWICYPLAGDETAIGDLGCQEALIWNYENNTMYFHDLGRISHISFGKTATAAEVSVIDDVDVFVDDVSEVIEGGGVLASSAMIGCSFGRDGFFTLDKGTEIDGVPVTCTAERLGLAMIGRNFDGSIRVDHQKVKIVESLWPTFEVAGVTLLPQLSVGAQEYRDGPVLWDGPYEFDPLTQQEMDFLVEGVYIAVKFVIQSSQYWKLHAYGLEIATAGDML